MPFLETGFAVGLCGGVLLPRTFSTPAFSAPHHYIQQHLSYSRCQRLTLHLTWPTHDPTARK